MNVAFPAVLLALMVLPGSVFRYTYARGSWGWTSPVSFRSVSDELAYGAIFAVVLHSVWLFLASRWGYAADYASLLAFLTGNFGPNSVRYDVAVRSFTNHAGAIASYFLSLIAFSATLGRLAHKGVRLLGLDKATQILRFKNEWFYLLSGEVLEFGEQRNQRRVDGTFLSAVVDHGKEPYLYRGVVTDWSFDADGNLDNVRLELAHRRKLSDDGDRNTSEYEIGEFVEADDRYYSIRGDVFILRYSEMRTINLDYFQLTEIAASDVDTVHDSDHDASAPR